MTLDKLLLISADEWDKLSDAELTKLLQPHFTVTRPNPATIAAKQEQRKARQTKASKSSTDDLIRMAREMGILVPDKKTQ